MKHNDDITEHNDDITGHNDDITGHNDDITGHNDDITGHNDDITEHNDDITGHNDDITEYPTHQHVYVMYESQTKQCKVQVKITVVGDCAQARPSFICEQVEQVQTTSEIVMRANNNKKKIQTLC